MPCCRWFGVGKEKSINRINLLPHLLLGILRWRRVKVFSPQNHVFSLRMSRTIFTFHSNFLMMDNPGILCWYRNALCPFLWAIELCLEGRAHCHVYHSQSSASLCCAFPVENSHMRCWKGGKCPTTLRLLVNVLIIRFLKPRMEVSVPVESAESRKILLVV